MMSGLTQQWDCALGEWAVWAPSHRSREAMNTAALTDNEPSFIQEDHLRSGTDEERAVQRLVYVTFTMNDVYDQAVMERAFTEYARLHSSYHAQYVKIDGGYRARYIAPDDMELAVVATSSTEPGVTAKDYLQSALPDLDEWSSFAFGVTGVEAASEDDPAPQFTVLIAADHLFTDAISLSISFYELVSRYSALRAGREYVSPPVRSYRDFSAEQRGRARDLRPDHPGVARWREVVRRAGGMPKFPLPLGIAEGRGIAPQISVETAFLDPERVASFAANAKHCGGAMGSALLAVQAELERELTGSDLFTMMAPRSHRPDPTDLMSVGWYITLVPVQFSTRGDFRTLVSAAREALASARELERLPVFPVIDVLRDDPEFPVDHGFDAPMLSYIDITRTPGAELARSHDVSIFANATPMREVYMWINRDAGGLDFRAMYPGNPTAESSVGIYFSLLRDRLDELSHA